MLWLVSQKLQNLVGAFYPWVLEEVKITLRNIADQNQGFGWDITTQGKRRLDRKERWRPAVQSRVELGLGLRLGQVANYLGNKSSTDIGHLGVPSPEHT